MNTKDEMPRFWVAKNNGYPPQEDARVQRREKDKINSGHWCSQEADIGKVLVA